MVERRIVMFSQATAGVCRHTSHPFHCYPLSSDISYHPSIICRSTALWASSIDPCHRRGIKFVSYLAIYHIICALVVQFSQKTTCREIASSITFFTMHVLPGKLGPGAGANLRGQSQSLLLQQRDGDLPGRRSFGVRGGVVTRTTTF